MPYTYDYPRPMVTVDVVLFALQAGKLKVLLIQRKTPPFQDCWALPGGFLDIDEELEAAARRELHEETGLKIGNVLELGAFGKIGRDPRGRTISVVYLALAAGEPPAARAGDDAAAAGWFSAVRPPKLAFDHGDILRAARKRLRELAHDPAKFAQQLLARGTAPDRLNALLEAIA
jgi:8-oxo-dGTP diphosphatase